MRNLFKRFFFSKKFKKKIKKKENKLESKLDWLNILKSIFQFYYSQNYTKLFVMIEFKINSKRKKENQNYFIKYRRRIFSFVDYFIAMIERKVFGS